ncbi:hypothetical protein DY023_13565 [Microbacterium bovistercoris]|uniref:Uncharacterized protein n=1 Tax=Microbacterium bovistercoris TaxID=2293570 RepID=A0A371NS80_9MICO|nr:hypothetical protein DY023_13565 [Microbacterium bovistercoris]
MLAVGAVLGTAAGLFGSVFGPYYPGALGLVLAALGLVGARRRWGRLVLVIGLALFTGALLYVVLGLLAPSAPRSGSSGALG